MENKEVYKQVSENETIAEKCGLCCEVTERFKGSSLIFIIKNINKRRIEFNRDDKGLNVLLKGAKLIKDYFRITNECSSSYYIWKGRLYLNFSQFENYISKINRNKG